METIIREGTPKTPYVRLDGENGLVEIKGRSIPENSRITSYNVCYTKLLRGKIKSY